MVISDSNEDKGHTSQEVPHSQQQSSSQKRNSRLRPRNPQQQLLNMDNKRDYVRIDPEMKQELFRLVFREGFKIKLASRTLGIKYATAKTIVFHHRLMKKNHRQEAQKMCQYIIRNNDQKITFKIVSTLAGDLVQSDIITLD